MKTNKLNKLTRHFNSMEKMPVLFLGYGSPMNAIGENEFVQGFRKVTAMEKPKTIHDFAGFPNELYEVQYPAPGSPGVAKETKNIIKKTEVGLDDKWGLDHGTCLVSSKTYVS